MKISRTLWTAAAISALALAGCQQTGDQGDTEEAVAEDTLSGTMDDGDFEAEAQKAGEEIEEGVEQGVEAVGAGTEELGERIQESVDANEDDAYEADSTGN